jgi:hypothetical protein
MERFEVRQQQDGLWAISRQGCILYRYPTEKEARWAALMLASNRCESGYQASVTISPAHASENSHAGTEYQRFTGM